MQRRTDFFFFGGGGEGGILLLVFPFFTVTFFFPRSQFLFYTEDWGHPLPGLCDEKEASSSLGHSQNWIYDDVTQILNMASKPRHTISSLLRLEMTFSHSTLGAEPLNDEEAHECEKNGNR